METIRHNKPFLIEVLASDPSFLLQYVQKNKLITTREYNNLHNAPHHGEKTAIDLLDKLMLKGEDTCRRFLTLLGQPPMLETFPRLMEFRMPALTTDTPVQESNEGELYPMDQRPRGHCLIINNYNFAKTETGPKPFGNRNGTDKDAGDLCRVFSQMHFRVDERKDLPSDGMLAAVREFGQMDHAGLDAFVCCVLSHGAKGTVVGTDGKEVSIRDLTQPFTRCPTLVGKPKLFFIQACQGRELQPSAWVGEGHEEGEGDFYQIDALNFMSNTMPVYADFLIGMATVEDYQAVRHTRNGSVYIQELCKQLEWGCHWKKDILEILTRVNGEVSKQVFFRDRKQMPEPKYTLTKMLVLTMD